MPTPTRWSSSLPYLPLTDVTVPAEAAWADISDQQFRLYVWLNGRAQVTGRLPATREIVESLSPALRHRPGGYAELQRAMDRTQLEVVACVPGAPTVDRWSDDVYAPIRVADAVVF